MQNESLNEFNEALDEYGVSLNQFKSDEQKLAVVTHAQGNKNIVYLALFHSVTHSLNNTKHGKKIYPVL